jgi:protein-tyrosine phosphatase
MIVQPYWVNTQLAIVPRPYGGRFLNDEMLALRHAGVDIVVSVLQKEEAVGVGLGSEEESATRVGIEFINFEIPDRGVPVDLSQFMEFLTGLEARLAQGKRIGFHCFGCIGRSPLVLASLLIRSGIPTADAWNQIEAARGSPVPDTLIQLEWVERHMRPKA